MPTLDPVKNREYRRKSYLKNREKEIAKASARTKIARDLARAHIRAQKEKPCTDCKKEYPWYVMDFDHIQGDKTENVSNMMMKGYSIKSIQQEIDKCELVCANCHRERTFNSPE